METGIYVALSSQIALEKRLSTIADNVANASTAGFRSSEVKFDQVMTKTGKTTVDYVGQGQEFLSTQNGALQPTGNTLDFAVRGGEFFQIQTPAGTALTRDGRLSLTANGDLVNVEGYPVLDAGGAPIQLPTSGDIAVGRDGSIHVNGQQVTQFGLFTADMTSGFTRVGSSAVIPDSAATAVVDRANVGVLQGFIEESNVNPVQEMTQLIMVQRNFEDVAAMVTKSEGSLEDAIKTLGSRNS